MGCSACGLAIARLTVALIRQCAAGDLGALDERQQLLVGMLAVVAIFDLLEPPRAGTEEEV